MNHDADICYCTEYNRLIDAPFLRSRVPHGHAHEREAFTLAHELRVLVHQVRRLRLLRELLERVPLVRGEEVEDSLAVRRLDRVELREVVLLDDRLGRLRPQTSGRDSP
jgi:hypothetical protein